MEWRNISFMKVNFKINSNHVTLYCIYSWFKASVLKRKRSALFWVITQVVVAVYNHYSLRNNTEETSTASIYKSLIRKLYITNLTTITKNIEHLTFYVPRIVTNYINKPTRCTFCMYLFYNLCTTLHVSNGNFFHHQEFIITLSAALYKPCKRV